MNRELERLKTRVGRIAVATAEGAEVLIDDEVVGVAPLPAPIAANTGRHKVTVNPPGRAAVSRVVDVAGLETTTVTLGREEPLAAPSVSPGAPSVSATPLTGVAGLAPQARSKTPMIVGWIATGTLAAVAGVMAGLAFGSEGGLSKARATLGVTQDTLNLAAARVGSFSVAADVLGLAAIVAGSVSLVLTVNALSTDEVRVAIGPAGVSVFARF